VHTEHLQDLRIGWVAAGWLVAIATTSLVSIVLVSLQLVDPVGSVGFGWGIVATVIGFWVGGFFTGFRALRTPMLHGIAIGLATLAGWVAVNLLSFVFAGLRWQGLPPGLTAALLLVQMFSAVAGAWVGHRVALRGGVELRE